jgi:hypothetical protein
VVLAALLQIKALNCFLRITIPAISAVNLVETSEQSQPGKPSGPAWSGLPKMRGAQRRRRPFDNNSHALACPGTA